jgi:hypothetical protein
MRATRLPGSGGRGSFGARLGIVAALSVLAAIGSASIATASPWSSSAANAPAHSSASKVSSTVNVAGVIEGVKGSVKSRKRQCEKGRLASLILVTPTGFQEIDREKTTRQGAFSLEGAVPGQGQTYFVGVGKKTITKFRLGRKTKKTICTQTESDPFVP